MKLTKKTLLKIIKEEVNKFLTEGEVVDLFPDKVERDRHGNTPEEAHAAAKKRGLLRIPAESVDQVWDMMKDLVSHIMGMADINKYDHKETLVGMFADSLDAHGLDDLDS